MEFSNFLAEVFGFSFVVVSLSLLVNPKNLKKLFLSIEDEACLFYAGFTAFVAGIAIALSHNIWVYDWRVVITVLGWSSLVKGGFALLWPDLTKELVNKFKEKEWVSIAPIATVFAGLILIYLGFTY